MSSNAQRQRTGVPATSLEVLSAFRSSYIISKHECKHCKHTTVSVTNGVGVQPRGGVRSSEDIELEKGREINADCTREIEQRGTDRPSR